MRLYKGLEYIIFTLVCALVLVGCSTTRHLNEDELLLRHVHLKLNTDKTLSEKGALNDQLRTQVLQKPNTYLFELFPYKVWLYNFRYSKYQKDTANFQVVNKVVEKPVVFDSMFILRSKDNMLDFLRNQGYFYAEIQDTIKYRKKKVSVYYLVQTGISYLIDSVDYEIEDPGIRALTGKLRQGSLLTKNRNYTHTLAGEERSRLVNEIRNHGYYKFTADNIRFELDTLDKSYFRDLENPFESAINFITLQRHKKKPALKVKILIEATDNTMAFQQYTFKDVFVFPDYSDTGDFQSGTLIEQLVDSIHFRYHKSYVNTTILNKKIFIRPGNVFSQSDYNQTIRQLNDLGIFQYVRLFVLSDSRDSLNPVLNGYVMMNPSPKYDFNTSIEVSGGDLYAIGTAANASVTNKNFLKGANQLTTTLSYGVELGQNTNIDLPYHKQLFLFSQNLGINFRLTFPKFLLPINQGRFSQLSLPRTFFNTGLNVFQRWNYFDMRSFNAGYGYIWKATATQSWSVKPAFINTLSLSNVSDTFRTLMESIPAIRNSYQQTLIEGEGIEYFINTEGRKQGRYVLLRWSGEEAGALLSGVKGLAEAAGRPLSFNHANYVRLDFDMRQYLLRLNSSWAFRFYGGVGIPYGPSTILPYVKQYFVGGAYSIRGWRPRVLGPGSYYDSTRQNAVDNLFVDQSGDIKLELNGEYRFSMIKLFSGAIGINGAAFVDAGNIWLARKDEKLEGADFEFKNIYKDLAVSSGAGLRFDLGGFLVLRMDWAIPLKKPYIREDAGWVLSAINLSDREWRRKNINLNLAIGYPF